MSSNLETVKLKIRAYNTGRGTIKDVSKELEGFENKFRDFLRVRSLEVWVEQNCKLDMNPEDVLRLFIEKEILGKRAKR